MVLPKQRTSIHVYLVDDHALIRSAFRGLFEQLQGFTVVGESGDARQAIDEIASLRPDVVLLDITMPGLSGIDAIAPIRKASSRSRVVMLTHHEGETFVRQALDAGAEGYLSKDSEAAELELAIRAVHRGDPYVSPKVASVLVTPARRSGNGEPPKSRIDSLTPREREVFQLLAVGKANKRSPRSSG